MQDGNTGHYQTHSWEVGNSGGSMQDDSYYIGYGSRWEVGNSGGSMQATDTYWL